MPSASSTLNICIASRAPFVGGAEIAALRLATGLTRQGHRVVAALGASNDVMQRFVDAGISTVHTPIAYTGKSRFLTYSGRRRRIRRLLRDNEFDILHVNDLPTAQIFLDAAQGLSVRTIVHHRFLYNGPAIEWFNKHEPDRHLFVSEGLMKPLCEASPRLAAAPREVVYDGLPVTRSRRRHRTKPTVLFAGQMIFQKGPQDLLRAWALLPAVLRESAELVMVGDDLQHHGRHRRDMIGLAALLGVRADLPGFEENMPARLARSDIAVVPSHVEPLGNATLEAMASGMPVIGSRVGGIPEMIDDGVTGLLVSPGDPADLARKLEALLANASLRRAMGDAGYRRCVDRFSLDAHVTHVTRVYQNLLEPATLRAAA